MRRAQRELQVCFPECARPTGALMVAPAEVPRNAEGAQFEGRASPRRGASEKRSQGQYKG